MFFIQYFLFLLLIDELISHADQENSRNKRFLFRKSKSKPQDDEDLLTSDEFSIPPRSRNQGYTQQELTEIKRILSKNEKDYYGILGIPNPSAREKIMSAYKKLTLRVHPDKFDAPGATEATQRLNKARTELLRRFEQTTPISRPQSATFTENPHRDVIYKSSSEASQSESASSTGKSSDSNSRYILIGVVTLFFVGLIILFIVWMKRQRHRDYSKNHESGDVRVRNRDSQSSNLQGEEE